MGLIIREIRRKTIGDDAKRENENKT
jgi:hypothetical protein